MIVLHTLVADKDYSHLSSDVKIKEMKPIAEVGLPEVFYGGSVTHIAWLFDSPFMLLLDLATDGIQVKDIAVENLHDLNISILKDIAKAKKIEYKNVGMPKDELIEDITKAALVLN